MSFGRPGFADVFKPSPPARGSFPLDHDGRHQCICAKAILEQIADILDAPGECKAFMISYLKCMKENANDNGKCRLFSKQYLECRMDK